MPLKRKRQSRNIQGLLLVVVLLGAAVLLVRREGAPALNVSIPMESAVTPTPDQPSWQVVLQQQAGLQQTPLPTVDLPTAPYVPPTLAAPAAAPGQALAPGELLGTVVPTNTPLAPRPTATAFGAPLATPTGGINVVEVASSETRWQPPPLREPLSLDPRDHYWFARPVDSNAVNYGLFYYPYGSDGPDNEWRVHHGIDMPNPIGRSVRASGPGIVLWAANGFRVEEADGTISETTASYGNTVLIKHDFGYRGQPLYTLYAHLSAITVTRGQRVATGDVIGLIGDSGVVTGPHVHLEVRVGRNSWYAVRNPVLWVVPYAGHGTIAGRVYDADGELLSDADISIIDRETGRVVQTTGSYVHVDTNRDRKLDILGDDVWNENFAVGDIPAGRYRVVTRINETRVAGFVEVFEGTTSYIELMLPDLATQQAEDADGSQ